jgi:hypothetical protein
MGRRIGRLAAAGAVLALLAIPSTALAAPDGGTDGGTGGNNSCCCVWTGPNGWCSP